MLIGTHGDLMDKRVVSDEEIEQCATNLKFSFFITSAVDGMNVEQAFCELARLVLAKTKQDEKEIESKLLNYYYYYYHHHLMNVPSYVFNKILTGRFCEIVGDQEGETMCVLIL